MYYKQGWEQQVIKNGQRFLGIDKLKTVNCKLKTKEAQRPRKMRSKLVVIKRHTMREKKLQQGLK